MTRRRRIHSPLLLLAALAVPTTLAAGPAGPGGVLQHREPAAVARLMNETGGKAQVRIDEATGTASFVRLPGSAQGGLRSQSAGATAGRGRDVAALRSQAMGFLRSHGALFGLANAEAELKAAGESRDRLGATHLSYQQVYRGVPVFGAVLKTHFDAAGELRAVNGTVVPAIDLDPTPSFAGWAAGRRALAIVHEGQAKGEIPAGDVATVGRRLLVFRSGLAQGVPGSNHLAWEVEVGNGRDVREFVYVDAHSGKLLDRITGIHDGLHRRAYNGLNLNAIPPSYPASPFWVEGNPFPTGVTEADNMLISSSETYFFFLNAFGRDSIDGNGAVMDAIFNRGYSCPNASWNGTFISFCPGLTTDDVTTHEWGHAYTQYTHGLIYQWQPGALNESYSDIWGETVDRLNGRGTDIHTPRTLGLCTPFQIYPPVVRVTAPAAIAADYPAAAASFGSPIVGAGISGGVVNALDPANAAGPTTFDACSPLTNAADVAGKIALVYRGTCAFTIKVKNAQNAGAIGVIVSDNVVGGLAGMSGVDPTITIPSLRVTKASGDAIFAATGVTAALRTTEPAVVDNSTSWLIGEDDTAPGLTGALRDMWSPQCLGNPGKVSDPEYWCLTGDNGGVHINSGIPNLAYALLVDGGTYNGQTVNPIGLTKAAHIYYRAMVAYQTPTSDFADHAIALDQSCSDLVGVNLADLLTGAPSGQVITAADCAEIGHAMAAVEMSNPPVQCGFIPILNPAPPARCAAGSSEVRIFDEDFEGGAADWTVSRLAVAPSFTPRDWSVVATLPDDRDGSAFFGPDPTFGLCTAASNESGVLHLDGPEITLPVGALQPSLTFDHWVATEPGFDGGNLKVSVNGGAWQIVVPAHYTFNPPNRNLVTAAGGNSDPLAGQPAFSGTNPGEVDGSWGRSHVNLAPYAVPGDSVQLRFDLGSDCGGGRFGWYVDDPVVYQCVSDAAPTVSISDASIAEGHDGFQEITFTVSLSAPTSQAVTVHYKTGQGAGDTGTASNGTDYLPIDGDLVFPALTLETEQTVTVQIKGDRKREADETFHVNLSVPVNATIGDGQGQGTILNDD